MKRKEKTCHSGGFIAEMPEPHIKGPFEKRKYQEESEGGKKAKQT